VTGDHVCLALIPFRRALSRGACRELAGTRRLRRSRWGREWRPLARGHTTDRRLLLFTDRAPAEARRCGDEKRPRRSSLMILLVSRSKAGLARRDWREGLSVRRKDVRRSSGRRSSLASDYSPRLTDRGCEARWAGLR